MPEKKKAHHKHSKSKSGKHGGDSHKKEKKKKKGNGACGCMKKQDVESDVEEEFPDELQPLLDAYAGDDYESAPEPEEPEPMPVTQLLLPKNDSSSWSRRPPLVEVSLFLYNLAYRASIPLKEQVIFGAIAAQYSASVGDFVQSNDDRMQACLASVPSLEWIV